MNPDATNADRCLSDAAKQAERKRVEEQTCDKLDVIACDRTRMIAEALINQLTNEEDGNECDSRNADRISKLRDSSKLFEPVRDQKLTAKVNRPVSAEPAKKLLRELLAEANAQLRAEETKPTTNDSSKPACDEDSGCQPKLTTKEIQTIVLQSATTKNDLEAQKPTQAVKENVQSTEVKAKSESEKSKTENRNSGKNVRASRTDMPGARKQGSQAPGNKNILSLISQSEALVTDAVRKAQGSLKKVGAD
jgi:hypothetical protein